MPAFKVIGQDFVILVVHFSLNCHTFRRKDSSMWIFKVFIFYFLGDDLFYYLAEFKKHFSEKHTGWQSSVSGHAKLNLLVWRGTQICLFALDFMMKV